LVVTVTPASSVSFFRPEFNDFLYAPIGAYRNEMPLSVLSALARLDLDPWQEASELSDLPKDTAKQRLASLIARLPGGRWARADSRAIAERLIDLLPRPSSSKAPLAQKAYGLREITGSTFARILICAALGGAALIIAASREPSSRGDHTDAPAFSTASPPQTTPATSRQ
jgi:hypothetical protein